MSNSEVIVVEQIQPQEIDSLCMSCGNTGKTNLLLHNIPFFKEVVIASFFCPACGFKNSEVQFGGIFEEKGVQLILEVKNSKDLNRQIVKSDYCTMKFVEIDFEIPPETQSGIINTLEGFLNSAIDGLSLQQPIRKALDSATYQKIENVIQKLISMRDGQKSSFTVILDDPSGNSAIELFNVGKADPNIKRSEYIRTKAQNRLLGLGITKEEADEEILFEEAKITTLLDSSLENRKTSNVPKTDSNSSSIVYPTPNNVNGKFSSILTNSEDSNLLFSKTMTQGEQEIMVFPEHCYNCGLVNDLRMVVCHIPHFKEVILMAFACDSSQGGCGYRTTEVKPGGGVSENGTRISLNVKTMDDLSRDVLKSESAIVEIPEIELIITQGSMGGRFTTVEGLLRTLKEKLTSMYRFQLGDSIRDKQTSPEKTMNNWEKFLVKLDQYADGLEKFTLIIDDPESNSYIQNLYAPDNDPEMKIDKYVRTWEQDEELGLHDMHV